MKSRKSIQVLVVTGALSLLACYVVYSQHQQMQNIASGSKSAVVDIRFDSQFSAQTNLTLRRGAQVIVPASQRGGDPLLFGTASGLQSAAEAKRLMIAPGSKSAAVFNLPRAMPQKEKASTPAESKSSAPSPFSPVPAGSSVLNTNRSAATAPQTRQNTNAPSNHS
jgi:hypothetical protein